jgi:fatty-acyl-CoA synthase
VVDANGRTVLVGQRGHLLTKGYIVMKSYWNNPLKTAESIKDGWMHTGDAATIDAEGFCRIVGRMGDMIIRGGENIYPREIEEFLYSHPAISDVQVVGLPDPVYQEEVCAWIIVKRGMALSEAEIRAFCKKNLSHFKIPRYIKFVEEFPLTVTGKVQKFVMREQSMKEYNLRENPAPKSA